MPLLLWYALSNGKRTVLPDRLRGLSRPKRSLVNNAASVDLGSVPPSERMQHPHERPARGHHGRPKSGHTTPPQDAAVRPVEPAVRCTCKNELRTNLQFADEAGFRCTRLHSPVMSHRDRRAQHLGRYTVIRRTHAPDGRLQQERTFRCDLSAKDSLFSIGVKKRQA